MIQIECPNCKSQLKAPIQAAGRTAKCKKCNTPIKIPTPSPTPVPIEPIHFQESPAPVNSFWDNPVQQSEPKPPAIPVSNKPEPSKASRKKGIPSWAIGLATAVPCLGAGYFAGREHVKYELKSAMQAAASAFSQGASKAFGQSPSTPSMQSVDSTPPEPEKPRFEIGQQAKVGDVAITLKAARIEKPELKSFGGNGVAENEAIVFEFDFTNTSERKILRFNDSMYSSNFSLKDDVGNQIRGVTYGINKPIGSLDNSDINPGQNVSHIEIFSVPPPKTEYLVLRVDLKCVGAEGKVEFKIPLEKVARTK